MKNDMTVPEWFEKSVAFGGHGTYEETPDAYNIATIIRHNYLFACR